MGLDMYLTGEKFLHSYSHALGEKKAEEFNLGIWRKHPKLHGYIVQWFGRGMDDCKRILLSPDHLRQIIGAVEQELLPPTSGFFFGESDGSEKPEDLEILNFALRWVEGEDAEGWRFVYYRASW